MMKTCTKCLEEKESTEFYRAPRNKDGLGCYCKDCDKERSKNWKRNNPEKERESRRRWRRTHLEQARQSRRRWYENNLEKAREYERRWQRNNPEKRKEAIREYKRANPEKIKAINAANHAIKTGKLTKTPCIICQNPKVEGHHPDYSKPLEVVWFCRSHHKQWHSVKRRHQEGLLT